MPLFLAAFVGGVFLLQLQPALPASWLIATIVAAAAVPAVLALRLRQSQPRTSRVLAVACALGLGFGHAAWVAHLRMSDELAWADEGRDVRVTGVVSSLPAQLDRGVRFEFDVDRIDTPAVSVPRRIALSWYGSNAQVVPAERWTFTVRLRRPHGTFNPGGFDLEVWMLERDLRATGYVRGDALRVAPWVLQPGPLVDRLRYRLRELMQRRLASDRHAGVIVALVLGDQRAIPADDWALFNKTGIAHLVSISGLHITMIAGLAAWLAGALWRRSRLTLALAPSQTAAAVAAMAVAFAYCLLAGWGVPAQRTFFMLAVVAAALLARRATHTSTTLALAAAVVCLLDPWAAIAPGFWLSFGAVAAILWVMAGRSRAGQPTWRDKLVAAGRAQLAVTVALVPLTIALFAQLSLVSPLANAVAIPVVSLAVTPLALLAAVFVAMPEPLASIAVPLLAFAHALFSLLADTLQALVRLPAASVPWPAPPAWALLCGLAGVAWLLAPRGWPHRWVGALWLLPIAVWPPPQPAHDELWVTVLDVGQGTSVLIETPGAAMLVDTGPRYTQQSDAGSRIIAPYLRRRGIDRLDLMVVSHLDSDHSGGAASLMKEISVERVLTSIDPDSAAVRGGRQTERCIDGQRGTLGPAHWSVVHPAEPDYARRLDTNSMSCVIVVDFGHHRVVLTGDVPAAQEFRILARTDFSTRPTTLLIAAHHGSRSSSSEFFVQAVRPRWVAYTVGYRNRFGHPHPEVEQRFERVGARAVRTDRSGASTWRMRAGAGVDVEQSRIEQARYWHNRSPAAAADAISTDASGDDEIDAVHRDAAAPLPN